MQNYFEQVGELLIEKPLREASTGDNLSTVVRVQTLAVLEGLDPERKRILLLFLYESGLIYEPQLVVSLEAANLSEAKLREANLSHADLSDANLSDAKLFGANLSFAYLSNVDLSHTYLNGADLSNADLREANLVGARLYNADLHGADLREANLSFAYLKDANLSEAKLSKANLSHATGKSNLQIDQQATFFHFLKDTTMPNGQKYEDWRKGLWAKEDAKEG